MNFSLGMQEGPKGLLKILKSYRDLQESAPKAGEDNLNNFRSNLKPLRNPLESFEDALKGKIESKDLSGNFDKNQLETEWAQLRPEGVQQRLS